LHAAFRGTLQLAGAVQQIRAEVVHHQSPASGAHRFM
jgi:hypothetical protein